MNQKKLRAEFQKINDEPQSDNLNSLQQQLVRAIRDIKDQHAKNQDTTMTANEGDTSNDDGYSDIDADKYDDSEELKPLRHASGCSLHPANAPLNYPNLIETVGFDKEIDQKKSPDR